MDIHVITKTNKSLEVVYVIKNAAVDASEASEDVN